LTYKEAFLAFQPALKSVEDKEIVKVDFDGVTTFSPLERALSGLLDTLT